MDASEIKKLSDLEHVLMRPSMYIGTTSKTISQVWMLDTATMKAERRSVEYSPGLEHLATEVTVNAYDNIKRSIARKIAVGKVEQTVVDKVVSVYNNGCNIPVVIHPTEKIWTPQMIFFMLRTSSNYDDNAERTWVGVNGVGVTCVIALSNWAEIEVADPINKLLYKQRCEKNLSILHPPVITPYDGKLAHTRVTYEADFSRFDGIESYSADMIKIMAFHAASASFTTKTPIMFNGVVMDFCSIEKYAALFIEKIENHLIYKDEHVELCLLDMPEKGFALSFVNGMMTRRGGVHVNNTLKTFTAATIEKLNKKRKLFDVRDTKKHLTLIISCTVVNPTFTSQTKEELEKPAPRIDIPDSVLKKVEKWNFVKQMSLYADIKLQGDGGKEKKKRDKVVIVEDMVDANQAGTHRSPECTLLLTEGLSAKTFAMRYRGCFPEGTDLVGVLPLRGKGLNVRNAKSDQLIGNKEILAIRDAVGIRPGVDYGIAENRKLLRYGKIRYCTDSDADGEHIRGLGLNLFGFSTPSLLKRTFIGGLLTPLLKATRGSTVNYFLTKAKFHEWYDPLSPPEREKWKIGYYKGLGRWEEDEFSDVSKFVEVDYIYDDDAEAALTLAFDKSQADQRKLWVSEVVPVPPLYTPDADGKMTQTISNFIHSCLKLFSLEDNERSLASMVDGFKTSQRKIFYGTRKKKLSEKEIKIAQFAGYVAENTAYEHGEDNIEGAIMNMCQDFPGANNIPLIRGRGNVGTRLAGGKDASNGRYVFMTKAPLADAIFVKEDDVLLDYLDIDGDSAEPRNYIPVVCLFAINGGKGIGTGFSYEAAPRNPKEVLAFQRAWLINNHPLADEAEVEYPRLLPWFRYFRGAVKEDAYLKYTTEGVFAIEGNKVKITELPINLWVNDYSNLVDKWLTEKKLSDKPRKDSKPEEVNFTLEGFANPTMKNLKLTTSFSDTNLVLYDQHGRICKYENMESVVADFCAYRYEMYEKRRGLIIAEYERDFREEQVKIDFLSEVISGSLVLRDPDIKSKLAVKEWPLSLLKLGLDSITDEGLENHRKKLAAIRAKIEAVQQTTARQLWLNEMLDFEKAYNKHYNAIKIKAAGKAK